MKTIKYIAICLLLTSSVTLFAQKKTFTRDYTYKASEMDSKVSSRTNATTEMRNILLREVGAYIRTEQKVITTGNTQEYIEKIEAITAGIVEMKVLDEKWDGETYYIKAEMVINPKEIEQKIKEIAGDKQKLKELEESRARTKAAEDEANRLRNELAALRRQMGSKEPQQRKEYEQKIKEKENSYNKQIETLSAEEYFTKGYTEKYNKGGVVINEVKWATRNVAAPGAFVDKPEDAGMFYQWNRKKNWIATGSVAGWDKTTPTGNTWTTTNKVCPSGYRLPTDTELKGLIAVGSKWTTVNGVKGRVFGSGNNTIFLPAAGYRYYSNGTLSRVGSYGNYWGSTQDDTSYAYNLYFIDSYADWYYYYRTNGFSVRPVAE